MWPTDWGKTQSIREGRAQVPFFCCWDPFRSFPNLPWKSSAPPVLIAAELSWTISNQLIAIHCCVHQGPPCSECLILECKATNSGGGGQECCHTAVISLQGRAQRSEYLWSACLFYPFHITVWKQWGQSDAGLHLICPYCNRGEAGTAAAGIGFAVNMEESIGFKFSNCVSTSLPESSTPSEGLWLPQPGALSGPCLSCRSPYPDEALQVRFYPFIPQLVLIAGIVTTLGSFGPHKVQGWFLHSAASLWCSLPAQCCRAAFCARIPTDSSWYRAGFRLHWRPHCFPLFMADLESVTPPAASPSHL